MLCWREEKLSLLPVKKTILPLQAPAPSAVVEVSTVVGGKLAVVSRREKAPAPCSASNSVLEVAKTEKG